MILKIFILGVFIVTSFFVAGQKNEMAKIKGGSYFPLYALDDEQVKVADFEIDVYPVSNEDYISFLEENPNWRKSKILALYADSGYLTQFKDDLNLKENVSLNAPVTNISWFAAKNYCAYQGKRLPTIDEWEYVGLADKNTANASLKKEFNQSILDWYEKGKLKEKIIGSTYKNYWGVYDMHGLVWEWTLDFNSVVFSSDTRNSGEEETNLFCGGAAIGASDLTDYAAFMRYAFRSSLKANYSINNLGFRCAK